MFEKNYWSVKMTMTTEAKAWIRRSKSEDEIVRILPDVSHEGEPGSYHLFTAFEVHSDYLGVILFDAKGGYINWIHILSILPSYQYLWQHQ